MSGDDFDLEEEHEEHGNHEAWVIPYADMLTLLMAMFLMLFAISSVDLEKFEKLAASLNDEFSSSSSPEAVLEGGPSVLDGAGPAFISGLTRQVRAEQALQRQEQAKAAAAQEQRELDLIETQVREYAVDAGIIDKVGFRRETRGLIVTIATDQVMFDPGGAEVRGEGAAILEKVAAPLRSMPNRVVVEGHTDSVPINTATYRSNWELSTARATEVLRYLVEAYGIPQDRVAAAGYGEQQPIASNADPAGRARNRRVEVAILTETVVN